MDTNIFIYAFDNASRFHIPSVKTINTLSTLGIVIMPQIQLEIFSALHYIEPLSQKRLDLIDSILCLPKVQNVYPLETTHTRALQEALKITQLGKRKIFDYYLAQTLVDNGVEVLYTHNTADFSAYAEKLTIINPLEQSW
ncbi:hypothetical protein KC686_02900 [Candidatus Woesebacteria bacterium]|nr:hypothetical protein [Candidatus Woesebacteria bacterium]